MLNHSKYILLFIYLGFNFCYGQKVNKHSYNYIFFLHNKYIEENDLEISHPEYGKAEYNNIIKAFQNDNFIVISEKRKRNTNVKDYAKQVCIKIDSLHKIGVKSNHITVIGTSKGGYIAQYVSTFMKNPKLNFVFIGCFQENDITRLPDINYCGNILSIYEKSDEFGVSAKSRKKTSNLKISNFKEIQLNTNLKHGFLFKPLKEWINPSKKWATRNYNF